MMMIFVLEKYYQNVILIVIQNYVQLKLRSQLYLKLAFEQTIESQINKMIEIEMLSITSWLKMSMKKIN